MLLSLKTVSRTLCVLLAALFQSHFATSDAAQQDGNSKEVRAAFDAGIETSQQFETVAKFIGASDEESKWQEIPWLSSLWEGIQQANEKKRPLFVWAMNGDPLGCV